MTALVGRETELATLHDVLVSARAGSGRLALLGGPAGIGKSALADRTVADARDLGMAVVRGHAVDDPGAPPLWPWRRALGTTADGLQALSIEGHDPSARFRLFTEVIATLDELAVDAGLLLVLDDLHWADSASLALLRHLCAELDEHRIAVVTSYRDTDEGLFHQVLPDLLRTEAVCSLALRELTRDEVASWLAVRRLDRDAAEAVFERAGGTPLLVGLLVDHLASGGAVDTAARERPDLRRLVTARLTTLAEPDREVLENAALLAERIHRPALAMMSGCSLDDLDASLARAVAAGVLVRTSTGAMSFTHALVRDAILADLAVTPNLSARHRAAAEALAAAAAPAAPIAMHWQRAGDAADHVRYWAERAAAEASRALAHDEAARFAELAVSTAPSDDDVEQARLLVALATALVRANRFGDAVEACARAAYRADRADRPDLLAAAALAVHGAGVTVFGALAPIVERALDASEPDDHAGRARLLAQLSVGATECDDVERGRLLASKALVEAEVSGDPVALVEALAARHTAIVDPDTVRERLELGRRAVELGNGDTSPIAALWGHLWRGAASFQVGNIVHGEREIAEIDRIARTQRSALARWHHHRFRAMAAALTGDFAVARAENMAAFHLGERVGDISLAGLSYSFGLILGLVRGDPCELLPGWREMVARAPAIPIVQISTPMGLAVTGQRDDARAEFARFRHLPTTMPRGVRWAGTIALVGYVALLLDDAEVCAAVYERYAPLGDHYSGDGSGAVFSHGANAGFAADLARVAGRHDLALPLYRVAVAMNERIGARPWTARARYGWSLSLRALDRQVDPAGGEHADDLLREATTEFRRLDMPGPLADALAVPPAPLLLSPREREVAGLVARSLSNREIAQQLFLSERTVESHVRSILAKLGATRRTEIVAWVVTQPDPRRNRS